MKAIKRSGASPGGLLVSAAKRSRLAALDDALSGAAPKARSSSTPAEGQMLPQSAIASKTRPGTAAEPSPAAEFPYDRLGDAVLDGSLSAALANAKAAAAAAAEAASNAAGGTLGTLTPRSAGNAVTASRSSSAAARAATAAAATAAAAGGDSVAAEVLAQLVATNPRASGSDLRNILSQRLLDRSVMLDNPTAPVKVNKMFARRGTKYSAKLRCKSQAKAEDLHPASQARRTPSYETMLRVHGLWLQYTQNLARSAAAAGGGAAPTTGGAGAAARPSAQFPDLHGAMLSVVKHVNPQLVGTTGVVLRRSSTSLHLVTPGDHMRVVPLKGCVAHYTVNGTTLQLTG